MMTIITKGSFRAVPLVTTANERQQSFELNHWLKASALDDVGMRLTGHLHFRVIIFIRMVCTYEQPENITQL